MIDLLEKWDKQVNRAQTAHYAAASRLECGHFFVGLAIMVLSTALLATAFAALDPVWRAATALANLVVVILAGLQTFVRLSERAEQHRLAAVRFGELRRLLEQHRATAPVGEAGATAFLDSFRARWDELSEESPKVPGDLWKQADERFFKGQ